MANWINDVLARLVAIEKEYMTTQGLTENAVPYFLYHAENPPYFTNRLADTPIGDNGSEIEDVYTPVFVARFVIGHDTSGVQGEVEYNMYEWAADFPKYINRREQLQSAAYPTRPTNFYDARCFNGGGFRILDSTGLPVQQFGIEFQVRIIRDDPIEQVYLGD